MGGTIFSCLRNGARKILRDQRGNAMFLTAAALVPIIGIVGSGIDIGRAYMAQLRLQQACDAGVLAGRRAMAAGDYTDTAEAEANKMFHFNYPDTAYGSSNVAFDSERSTTSTSNVTGSASANLPTNIMYIFGTDQFNLSVDCTAKLEISNTDVMMVLDVTGSMDEYITDSDAGGSIKKIAALRNAATVFLTTLTSADIGDGRLRIGVVPYSNTVNVGAIMKPEWLSDEITVPSRVANFHDVWQTVSNTNSAYTDTNPSSWSSWTNETLSDISKSSNCKGDAKETKQISSTTQADGQPTTANGIRTTKTKIVQNLKDLEYKNYTWSGGKCKRDKREKTYTRTTPNTLQEKKVNEFLNYTYKNITFSVSSAKNMTTELKFNTGTKGAEVKTAWAGCVMERNTTTFGPTATAPSDAYDMDIDSAPTGVDDTKWKLFLPYLVHRRSGSDDETGTNDTKSYGQTLADTSSENRGACPVPVMKLTTMDTAGQEKYADKIDDLTAKGYTYHDTGMAWGARLISPDGLFASENAQNAAGTNGRPIARHIIFMTDGKMDPPLNNLSHQGVEQVQHRVGATDYNDAIARHSNRLVQLCAKAKAKGIVIWIIGFGIDMEDTKNAKLVQCASTNKAFEAGSSAELQDIFEQIAAQISRLRLSE